MNKTKASIPSPHLISAFVVFISVLVLGFIFQDTLKETVLVYILYALWVGELAIKSLGQRLIWLVTLVITLILTLRFSRLKAEGPSKPPKSILAQHAPSSRRILFWQKRINVMKSSVERDYYLSDLYRLIIKILVHHEQSSPEDIKERLRSGELFVTSEVYDILGENDPQSSPDQKMGFIQKLRQLFRWNRDGSKAQSYLPDARLEKVAAYLESLLENEHDI